MSFVKKHCCHGNMFGCRGYMTCLVCVVTLTFGFFSCTRFTLVTCFVTVVTCLVAMVTGTEGVTSSGGV